MKNDQQNNNLNHHTQHYAGAAYYVLGYLEQAFPIHAQKLVEIDGNMVAEPLRDETGALVVSREALALRETTTMELMTLAPIPSAQVSAPFFRVCTSDVHGEKRFTSTIAKRLDQLGALTKGQRETGSQGMFREEDNLESPIARAALRGYDECT